MEAMTSEFIPPQILRSDAMISPDNNEVCQRLMSLPSVICAKVLSFLPWRDKLSIVAALPLWLEHLRTTDAWDTFNSIQGSTGNLTHHHQMIWWCMVHYGRYMRHCHLALSYFDPGDTGLEVLEHLAQYCCNLRTVRLDHPTCFSFPDQEMFERYVSLLKTVVVNCPQLQHISLCHFDYMAMNRRSGIQELLECLVEEEVAKKIRRLEFSHAYDYSSPVSCLVHFNNLVQLRCPIQVLSTGIIIQLVKKRLKELHVVNDGSTLNENFNEAREILWRDIHKESPSLQVHYIVQGRTLHESDLVPNPLLRTLVLDSLCNSIHCVLIDTISSLYAGSLTLYAHLATYWSYQPYDDPEEIPAMYTKLVRHCQKLNVFITEQEIPGAALLLIAANSRSCRICVQCDKIKIPRDSSSDRDSDSSDLEHVNWWETITSDVDSLRLVMSKFLGLDWRPMTREEFTAETSSLLHF